MMHFSLHHDEEDLLYKWVDTDIISIVEVKGLEATGDV